VVSSDPASVTARKGTLDLILNTIPSNHDYVYYQPLLTTKGNLILMTLSYDELMPSVAFMMSSSESKASK
jgi:D-arabinose 1-dehydrogenase-like Zn-dependent alcohol dehydrogenase